MDTLTRAFTTKLLRSPSTQAAISGVARTIRMSSPVMLSTPTSYTNGAPKREAGIHNQTLSPEDTHWRLSSHPTVEEKPPAGGGATCCFCACRHTHLATACEGNCE